MASSCEFEFMEYVDEDSIDSNLICSICHKPYKDPVCTPCDHTYGRGCITHWLTESIKYSCPTCVKQPLLIKDLVQARGPLRNMLDQLRVRCTLCEQTSLQRGNFVDHINKFCPKATVQCQAADIKCPWKGTRDELDSHISTCIFEPLRPVLASLIAENRQLIDQVQKHDNEIKKLTEKMSQLNNTVANDSNDESDTSSGSEFPVDETNQKEEDAIFIKKLPASVKLNDIFEVFSKTGRIKYNNNTKKAAVFIFKSPNTNDPFCNAKVVYVDKESASAAIAQYDQQIVPPWNTRLRVQISQPTKRNLNDFGKFNSEGNFGVQQEAKATVDFEKASNKGQNVFRVIDQAQSPTRQSQTTTPKNTSRRPRRSHQGGKPTS